MLLSRSTATTFVLVVMLSSTAGCGDSAEGDGAASDAAARPDGAGTEARCPSRVASEPTSVRGYSFDDDSLWVVALDPDSDDELLMRLRLDGDGAFERLRRVSGASFFSARGDHIAIPRFLSPGLQIWNKEEETLDLILAGEDVYNVRTEGGYVYFSAVGLEGSLQRIHVESGEMSTAFPDFEGLIPAYAFDDEYLYVAKRALNGQSGTIVRVLTTGGDEEPVAEITEAEPIDLEVVDGFVYYSTSNYFVPDREGFATSTYHRVPVAGGTPELLYAPDEEDASETLLGTGEHPESFQVYGDHIYLVTGGGFARIPIAGGDPEPIFEGDYSVPVYAHPSGLYLLDVPAGEDRAVMKAPWDTQMPLPSPLDCE